MTGGDTSYAAEIHDGVVYVGGHMRWFNNPFAVRPPRSRWRLSRRNGRARREDGVAVHWNPGRTRGVGLFDYFVTEQGVWAGSDTDRFNNELRARLAFFPFSGGTSVPVNEIGDLPNTVVQLGRTTGYDRHGRSERAVPHQCRRPRADVCRRRAQLGSGHRGQHHHCGRAAVRRRPRRRAWRPRSTTRAVPKGDLDRPPAQLWTTERNDPAGGNEMRVGIPRTCRHTRPGPPVSGQPQHATDDLGERVFDVAARRCDRARRSRPQRHRRTQLRHDALVRRRQRRHRGHPVRQRRQQPTDQRHRDHQPRCHPGRHDRHAGRRHHAGIRRNDGDGRHDP